LRRINILADKAMLAAYAGNTNKVTAKHVRLAARDSEFVTGWSPFNITVPLFALLLIAVVFWFSQQGGIMLSIQAVDSDDTHRSDTENTGILIEEAVGMPGDNLATSLQEHDHSEIAVESDAELLTGNIQPVDAESFASEVINENVQEHLVVYFDQHDEIRTDITVLGNEQEAVESRIAAVNIPTSEAFHWDELEHVVVYFDQYDEFQTNITTAGLEQDEVESEITAENIPVTANWEEETTEFQDEIHTTATIEGNSDFTGQLLDLTNIIELQDNAGSRITYGEPALLQQSGSLPHPTFD
jgi:hypothetical protein